MNETDKGMVAAYCGGFRRFKRVKTEVDGWTVVLDVWRQKSPLKNGRIAYLALLATGLEETGEYTAIMDCTFDFPKGYRKVMKDINKSIADERAMARLLSDAAKMMKEKMKKQQRGQILPS